ncbi:MAG: hypothetical protein Kow0031_40050 [Anaerolineae bacterium]
MSFYDDEQKRLAEEAKHAKTGGCIAAVLLLILVPPICYGVMNYTGGGRALQSHTVLVYTFYGVPGVIPGMRDMALQSCELDRTKPAGYQQQQAEMAETYREYATQYRENYAALVSAGQDTSIHEPPETVSTDINGGKINFCFR